MYIEKQEDLCEGKFAGYRNLVKVIFGPDVNYIPENCFNGCDKLKEIIFQGNINSVEAAAFMNCDNLQIINANNIGIIKDFAFYGCNNIFDFNIKEDIACIILIAVVLLFSTTVIFYIKRGVLLCLPGLKAWGFSELNPI